VQPSSIETTAPAAESRIETARRRIREGYYARPEIRRTIAEIVRRRLLRRAGSEQTAAAKTP
jgi:hypothetical protein